MNDRIIPIFNGEHWRTKYKNDDGVMTAAPSYNDTFNYEHESDFGHQMNQASDKLPGVSFHHVRQWIDRVQEAARNADIAKLQALIDDKFKYEKNEYTRMLTVLYNKPDGKSLVNDLVSDVQKAIDISKEVKWEMGTSMRQKLYQQLVFASFPISVRWTPGLDPEMWKEVVEKENKFSMKIQGLKELYIVHDLTKSSDVNIHHKAAVGVNAAKFTANKKLEGAAGESETDTKRQVSTPSHTPPQRTQLGRHPFDAEAPVHSMLSAFRQCVGLNEQFPYLHDLYCAFGLFQRWTHFLDSYTKEDSDWEPESITQSFLLRTVSAIIDLLRKAVQTRVMQKLPAEELAKVVEGTATLEGTTTFKALEGTLGTVEWEDKHIRWEIQNLRDRIVEKIITFDPALCVPIIKFGTARHAAMIARVMSKVNCLLYSPLIDLGAHRSRIFLWILCYSDTVQYLPNSKPARSFRLGLKH